MLLTSKAPVEGEGLWGAPPQSVVHLGGRAAHAPLEAEEAAAAGEPASAQVWHHVSAPLTVMGAALKIACTYTPAQGTYGATGPFT